MQFDRYFTAAWLSLLMLIGVGCASAPSGQPRGGKKHLDQPVPVATLASGPLTLDVMNERWRGAPAQTRVPLRIEKGKGWVHGPWKKASGERIRVRFWVSDRQALRPILPKKNLLVGARLVGEGWRVQKPKKGQGIEVEFRFENYPARARLEFDTDLEHLGDVERFMKVHLLAVQTRDELLFTSDATPATAAPATTAPPADDAATSLAPGLNIVSAAAQPAVVRAGGEVLLQLTYEHGAPAGSSRTVLERRTVSRAGDTVGTFEESFERGSGTFTSQLPLTIPVDAASGFYAYKAEVIAGELRDEHNIVFEVR